jgi:hypothetical protein
VSDETYFDLTNRIWDIERPTDGIEKPLHFLKVLVFCAISATKIYGPYYFTTSVNQQNYLEILKVWFWPENLRTSEYKKYYFQQDGAPPLTSNIVQECLASKFGQKFLAKGTWPDLNPFDYFLWVYLKDRVYNLMPKTLDDLKVNIECEIRNIKQDVLKSAFLNFRKRANLIIEEKGGHIQHRLKTIFLKFILRYRS